MNPLRSIRLCLGAMVLAATGAIASATTATATTATTAAAATPAKPAAPVARNVDCPFTLPGVPMQCGRVDLPADHAASGAGPRVSLFYVRVPAREPDAAAGPVVLLAGGPGMAGSQTLRDGAMLYAGLQPRHDLIFVDQRGTGESTPSLRCPAVGGQAVLYGALTEAQVRDCLQPLLRAGYRTAWFDTVQSALDVIALRQALGIARWNLMGTSYGTALAQEVLRRDAAATRAVVLNSPTRASASEADTATVLAVAAAWNQIFLDCASAPACANAVPGMRERYFRLVQLLRQRPLPAQWQDPAGQTQRGALDADALQVVINDLAGAGQGSSMALSTLNYLLGVASGSIPENPEMIGALYLPATFQVVARSSALGLNLSVICREVMPGLDLPALRARAEVARPFVVPSSLMRAYQTACPVWGAGRADPALNTPVSADVPVLLLTGNYDMAAPAHLAQSIAAALPRVRLVSFNGIGHAVFEAEPCARTLVADFLREARTDVATACVPATPASGYKPWTP